MRRAGTEGMVFDINHCAFIPPTPSEHLHSCLHPKHMLIE
jgi:hypothetical protein